VHLSIGEIYTFSVFNNPLVERFGTGLTPIGIIFSISIVMLGLSAAVLGTWVERVGRNVVWFASRTAPSAVSFQRSAIGAWLIADRSREGGFS